MNEESLKKELIPGTKIKKLNVGDIIIDDKYQAILLLGSTENSYELTHVLFFWKNGNINLSKTRIHAGDWILSPRKRKGK